MILKVIYLFFIGIVVCQVKEQVITTSRGQNCGISRKNYNTITKIYKCEKGLICTGIGPGEYKNGFGQAHSTNYQEYYGVCISPSDVETI